MIAASADQIRAAGRLMLFKRDALEEAGFTDTSWPQSWFALLGALPFFLLWTACLYRIADLPEPGVGALLSDVAVSVIDWLSGLGVIWLGAWVLGSRVYTVPMLTLANWMMLWAALIQTPIILAAAFGWVSAELAQTVLWLLIGYLLAAHAFALRQVLAMPKLAAIATAMAMLLSSLLVQRLLRDLAGG
jgi:hypothetical protein